MSELPDGPLNDPMIRRAIENNLAEGEPGWYSSRVLQAMLDHGSRYKEALVAQNVEQVCAVTVAVPAGPFRKWRRQQQASGLSPGVAKEFAPWFQGVWREWLERAHAETEFIFGYFPVSTDCCKDTDREYVFHVVDYRGPLYRFEFVEEGSRVELVARSCGQAEPYDKLRERLASRGGGPSAEAVERVQAQLRSWARDMWDSAFKLEPAVGAVVAPSAEERRAKRVAKLKAEAEKLGFDVVDREGE